MRLTHIANYTPVKTRKLSSQISSSCTLEMSRLNNVDIFFALDINVRVVYHALVDEQSQLIADDSKHGRTNAPWLLKFSNCS